MDENTTIWDKKMDDLTVKDMVLLNVALPIIAIGGMAVAGAVTGGFGKAINKFRTRKTVELETTN